MATKKRDPRLTGGARIIVRGRKDQYEGARGVVRSSALDSIGRVGVKLDRFAAKHGCHWFFPAGLELELAVAGATS